MKVQRDQRKDWESNKDLRERALHSRARRKKELRTRLILLNSALALVIIMIVLVCKVVSLNRQGSGAPDASKKGSVKVEADKDKNSKKEKKPKATAAPTATPAPEGSAKWLRKDLDPSKPMVALTFDDGPYTPVTKRILKTLEKYDAKATFFCVGNRVPTYSDMVKKEYALGCQVASHTYGHVFLTKVKKKQIKAQVNKVDKVMEEIIGCSTTALRPPGGCVNDKVRSVVKVPMVCWNIDSEDWRSRNTSAVLKKCRSITDGDIVLMHDLYPTTAAAVEKLIPRLKKKGFQMVTVDELFYYKGIDAKGGKVYFSGK